MKKLLFVYNPHSGKGLIKNKLCDILDIFAKAGYEMTVCPTQHAMDGYDKVCEADVILLYAAAVTEHSMKLSQPL